MVTPQEALQAAQQEALRVMRNTIMGELYYPKTHNLAEFKDRAKIIRDSLKANQNPVDGSPISAADAALGLEALNAVEGPLREVFKQADSFADKLRKRVIPPPGTPLGPTSPFDSLGDAIGRVRAQLLKNGPIDTDTNRALTLSARQIQDEIIAEQRGERDQEFGYLGNELWRAYKIYRTDRQTKSGNEQVIIDQTVLAFDAENWHDAPLEDLFQQTWVLEQKIAKLAEDIKAGNQTNIAQLQDELNVFKARVQPIETGASASRVLHARLESQLESVLRGTGDLIDPKYMGRVADKLLPKAQVDYGDFLQGLSDLNSTIDRLHREGKTFLDLTESEEAELNQLLATIKPGTKFLYDKKVPEFDRDSLNKLYYRLLNQAQVLLGEEVDETSDIFNEDVEWWLISKNERSWRSTQRLWAQFKSGGAATFSADDRKTLEASLVAFNKTLGQLVSDNTQPGSQYDVAYPLRLAALDVQINRLNQIRSAIKDFDEKQSRAPKTETEILEGIQALYDLLRKKNVALPRLEELNHEMAPTFFRELHTAFFDVYVGLLDATTASGGGGFPFPGEVQLWSGENLKVQGEFDQTFEFFFEHFPYQLLCPPNIREGSKEYQEIRAEIIALYKFRLLGLQNNQNLAAGYPRDLAAFQNSDNRFLFAKVAADRGNNGGYFKWDQEPLNKRIFRGELLEQIFGEEDSSWLIGEYTNFFISRLEYNQKMGGDKAFIPIKFNTTKLLALKDEIFAEVPNQGRYDGDIKMMDVAWKQALFIIEHTNKLFGYDNGGLDTKMGRTLANRAGLDHDDGYASKIQAGQVESPDRITETISIQLERIGVDRERYIHILVNLSPDMYDEISVDELGAVVPYEVLHLNIISHSPGENIKDAINKRFKIIKIKPEFQSLGADTGMPIAIPRTFFDYAKNMGYPNLIPLYLSQVRHASIDMQYLDWDSLTPQHQQMYGSAMNNFSIMYEGFADYKGSCKFVDVNKLVHEKVEKKKHNVPKLAEIESQAREIGRIVKAGSIRKYNQSLEDLVHVAKISKDEVALSDEKNPLGLGFSPVIQKAGKYAFSEVSECGPSYPNEKGIYADRMVIINIWEDIYRSLSEYSIYAIEHGHHDDHVYKYLSDESAAEVKANHGKLNSDQKKEAKTNVMRTPVHPLVRKAIDNLQDAYKISNKKEREKQIKQRKFEAERTFMVIAFIIAFRSYLERYKFEHDDVHITTDVEGDYKLIKTISEWKALAPDTRSLLRAFFVAQMQAFSDPEFRGKFKDLPIYDENYFDSMLESFGLVDTNASFIVDRYWFHKDYDKLKEKKDH